MDHDRLGAWVAITAGGAVRRAAGAGQLRGPGGQRAQRIRAALRRGARVLLADPVNHLGQPPLQQGGIGGQQPTPQRRGAVHVVAVPDAEVPTARGDAGAPPRTGIVAFDECINGLFEFVRRQRPPSGARLGQTGIDERQRLGVLDELGAPGEHRHHPGGQLPLAVQGGHRRQAVAQGQRLMHQPRGRSMADVERGGHLGGRAVPPIAGPVPALVAVGLDPAGHQFGDRGQPSRPYCGFHPSRLLDRRDDRTIVGIHEVSNIHTAYLL